MGVVQTRVGPPQRFFGSAGGWSLASLGAVVAFDASTASPTAVSNIGSGGTGYNARYGSTTGADSNDPAWLPHTGTNYLYLPGVAGNYASTPDVPVLDITGDIEIVVRVGADSWTPTAEQYVVAKYFTTTSQRSFALSITPTGRLALRNSTDGINAIYRESVAHGLTATSYWFKVTLDVDTGSNTNLATFSYAADQATEPTSWTTISSTTTTSPTSTTTSIFSSSAALEMGSMTSGTNALAGKVYRAIVRNGIGGPTVFDADFTTGITSGGQTTFTESSANAATVTINRATSGRKAVAVVRPIWLFGTDDFMETPADPEGAYLDPAGVTGSFAQSAYASVDTGTATSGTTTTLVDTTKVWTASLFVGRQVRITGGTGVGQTGIITANTATQVTIGVAWAVAPDATSTYIVESAFNVTGDLEIVARLYQPTATNTGDRLIVARPFSFGGYYLVVNTSRQLSLGYSESATPTTLRNVSSSAGAVPLDAGVWVKVTRVAATGAFAFYTAADSATEPTSWTLVNSGTGVAGNLVSNSNALGVGGNSTSNNWSGNLYRAIVRNGIGGTVVADWAAYGHPRTGGTYRDTNQNTWSINGSATLTNGNRLNFGASDSFTILLVGREWATPTTSQRLFSKAGYGTIQGWHLAQAATTFSIFSAFGDGTTNIGNSPTVTAGSAFLVGFTVDRTANTYQSFLNTSLSATSSAATIGNSGNAFSTRIGGPGSGASNYADFEVLAVAVIPRALTAAEIAQINSYYGTA